MNIVIFGASGNLGGELVKAYARKGVTVHAPTRNMCDLGKDESIEAYLARVSPEIIINAAAYNAVDAVEQPAGLDEAKRLNENAPRTIARCAERLGAVLVHVSTDYVFSGGDGVFHEESIPNPCNAYGQTKLAGELAVRESCSKVFLVRTSKLFGRQGSSLQAKLSFVSIMAKLALTKGELTVVDGEVGCPTYTVDLATAILELLGGTYAYGVYHLVNEDDGVTWLAFAQEIVATLGLSPKITPIAPVDFVRPAKRPLSSILLNTKGPKLPSRKDALARFLLGPFKKGMGIEQTSIPGLFAFTPPRNGDERGWFSEVLNVGMLRDLGLVSSFVQINEGQSLQGIVRGMHFQAPPFAQTKIVACTAGRIFDVAVDIRQGSPTYGAWFGVELSAQNGKMLYIPEGFAHGMMALEDGSRIRYHVAGSSWEPSAESGLRFDDPSLSIVWPELNPGKPQANARDASWKDFSDFTSPFSWT